MDLLAKNGAFNELLTAIGFPVINFLGSPKVFPWTMIISDIWKGFGFGTVVYLAALTSIDPGLYESALLDGATRWQQIRYITIPLLMPTIILMTVLALGSVLNAGFDQIFNLYSRLSMRPEILLIHMYIGLVYNRRSIPLEQPSDYLSQLSHASW